MIAASLQYDHTQRHIQGHQHSNIPKSASLHIVKALILQEKKGLWTPGHTKWGTSDIFVGQKCMDPCLAETLIILLVAHIQMASLQMFSDSKHHSPACSHPDGIITNVL